MPRFSLSCGGPAYRLLGVAKFTRSDGLRLTRICAAFVIATWVPFLLIGLGEWLVRRRPPPALLDLSIHVRLLVAVPLVFVAEVILDERCASVIAQLERRLLDQHERDRLRDITHRAERLRDASWAEALLALAAVLVGQAAFHGFTAPTGPLGRRLDGQGSLSYVFYEIVGLPLFSFVVYRWIFRWIIWSRVLLELSRTDLRPLATHPDRTGGLDYLSEPLEGFSVFAAAMASIAASIWDEEIRATGASLASFVPTFAGLLLVATIAACGPLLVFVAPLHRARLRATRQYGEAMLDFVRLVQTRWIDGAASKASPLGEADTSHLADADSVYQHVAAMRVVPIRIRFLVDVVVAPFIPMLPLVAAQIPIAEFLKRVGRVALGGLPF